MSHDMNQTHGADCHCVRCRPLERPCACSHCEAFKEGRRLGAPKFKVGDRVEWTNEYGVNWGVRTIIEVLEPDKFGHRYYIAPNDAHWMYVREKNLKPTGAANYSAFGSF